MKRSGMAAPTRPYQMKARARAAQDTADRVLNVAVELFTDKPYDDVSLDEVAERAGISKRTVLRRFGSKEELFVVAGDRAGEEMQRGRNEAPIGDIVGAVANIVDHYERWGPNRLRMLEQEDRIPVVSRDARLGREYHWSWVEKTFAPLIAGTRGSERKRRIATLVVITDVYTWKLLRRDLGLSRSETEELLAALIRKLEGGK